MPDLDRLFADLRSDVASNASGSAPGHIARLGRARRARRRALGAGAVAAAVLAGGLLAAPAPRPPDRTLVRPTHSAAAPPELGLGDLVHWPEAVDGRGSPREGWSSTEDRPGTGTPLPGCSDREPEPQGWIRHLSLDFAPAPEDGGRPAAADERGEAVVLFAGPAQASAWLRALREQVEECGAAPSSAPVGDEGYRIEADQVPERSGRLFHLVSAVFYRQGPVVAVHSRQRFREERDTGETAGILQDLEEDARAFSQRLCARGFGC
ncbi:hypothetical protein [Actinocorallia populi]|uniref:hypothetical protein n=1 Tax=Actinocorallia populi TaxID=2079200 RepID=UPI000D092D1D|nr:hypothetical protein [Actinocorallia populi]